MQVFPLISRAKDAAIKQPVELTSYSRNDKGEIKLDDSELKYYYLPDSDVSTPGGIDLASGIKEFKQSGSLGTEFEGLLLSIEDYEKNKNGGKKIDSNLITWRGLLRKIMTLPFSRNEELEYNIIVFDGQIMMVEDLEFSQNLKLKEEAEMDEFKRKLIYSGYKFEQTTTLSKPWALSTRNEIEKRRKIPVKNNIPQYTTVVSTGIGGIKLTIGAEVDCVWNYKPNLEEGDKENPLNHYVELKTNSIINHPKSLFAFENKLFRTWAQCFLVGIPKIIVGFRDENMILRSVEEYETEKIPILIKNNTFQSDNNNGGNGGKKNVPKFMPSIKFLGGFLAWLNENIPKDDENRAWKLKYNSETNKDYLVLTEMTPEQAIKFTNPDTGLVSKKFRDWRMKN